MHRRRLLLLIALPLLTVKPAQADPIIGIGVALGTDLTSEKPMVQQVFPNTPAEKAKLPIGAILEKINGIPTEGRKLEECISQIRGPEGIPLLLEYIDPITGKLKKIMIMRERINVDR